ncbi:sigma-70 family RNA polymerase sigma factor [Singulisphaera acidiphila]|uniref:RNA polymerase sigma factor, sigma-70 family n=1 Tax=Singulisphaera acidiphila (strain ATCC BAA-1392 / DSM 18658 / VKM B-2454 / MOB10) TaxID=886293 RepID=L0DND2_SINAD|nr:sigma-70 family RNA polymerase sigma factor [Singulisphaera acidiphila]AGA30767.1 RNA polymerase sigma factor, sigma-70 family [Singulisphaera acidiphila DSM 18658]
MSCNSSETNRLLEQAALGDQQVLETLLVQHRQRLRRMIAVRLDQRLRKRVDPSDVIQEAYLEASARLTNYLRSPTMPFFLWLRFLTCQKMVTLHRHHLGVRMRDADQEVAFRPGTFPEASSAALAAHFLDNGTRPSEAAIRAEMKDRVRRALDGMVPLDREVLAMRHFEQLSRAEIAVVLDISEAAAGKRYLRALEKLKQILSASGSDWKG